MLKSDERSLVSIITPVLNREASIGLALASVARQTYPQIEHIIVDGGSSDRTLAIVSRYAEGRNVKVISEPDRGMYDAINKGLHLARGHVIAYLNSDDLYLPWTAEEAVAALACGVDLIYGDLGIVTTADDRQSFYPQFYPPWDVRYYTHHGTLGQPTVFWRRSVTEKIGTFDDSLRLLGDCEYWLRAAASGFRFQHVREIMALQMEHGLTLRATHPEHLKSEFEHLRARYGKVFGPPRSRVVEGVRRRLRWRALQFRFLLAGLFPLDGAWRRFISWSHENGVRFRPLGLLALFLPSAMRPAGASLLDASAMVKGLGRIE